MYRRPSRPGRRATVDRAERPFDGLLRFAASRLPANQRMEPSEPDVFPSARSLGRRLIRTFGDGTATTAQPVVNWFHRHVCQSGRWSRRLEGELLPWALQGVELGDDVLEVGPGPGLTTDLLRSRTKRLTALEVETNAATALRQRLGASAVRIVHGDGTSMPFEDGSYSAVVAF